MYCTLKAAARTAKMQGPLSLIVVWGLLVKSSMLAAAANLPNDGNQRITQPGLANSSSLETTFPSTNHSALLSSNSLLSANEYDIVCHPRMGSNFDLDDCINSLLRFEIGRARMTFAERPQREGAISLPFRWMGRKYL